MLKKLWVAIIASQEKRAKTLVKYYHAHRTLMELSHLSEKELKDIGINRCDIPRIAYKGF
jgi:uncharacterized protein YjiS (DUF1127 family)